jgi:hypothetical protein
MSKVTGGDEVPILAYMIEFAVQGGSFARLATVEFGTNSYTHSALVGGLTYSYKIKAANKYGESVEFSSQTTMQTG